jgi:hypothetical protein
MLSLALSPTLAGALVSPSQPLLQLRSAAAVTPRSAVEPRMVATQDDICVDEICDVVDEPEPTLRSWWTAGSDYAEDSRQYRRTVYMHDEWVKHRSNERFIKNMLTISSSGVGKSLSKELAFVTGTAIFCVVVNCLLGSYQDLSGVVHPGPYAELGKQLGAISLPALPFSICMPALSLLLVFRTNTGYARWNEARTLWGGVINNCVC